MNTKEMSLENAIQNFISKGGTSLDELKQFRKNLNSEIQKRKRENMSASELSALRDFENYAEKRKEFYNKLDKAYFTANRARSEVQKRLRALVGYNKRKGLVQDPLAARALATAHQLENWERFDIAQFTILCKSHNSALKMLLSGGKLPQKITPKRYISAIMRGALLSERAFEARMKLQLPK